MKIIRSGECGNSPKNKFVEDYTLALIEKDIDYIVKHSTTDIIIPTIDLPKCKELVIVFAISHGRYGSALCRCDDLSISFSYHFKNTTSKEVKGIVVTKS